MSTADARPQPKFDWFIPIDGDGEHIGALRAERPPTFEYLRRVTETAERNGFHSLLIPTRFANGLFEETAPLAETWTTAAALAAVTSRIRFLIAVRPGFISAGLFGQMAATLDGISGGRIDLNVVPGGIQGDFERFGESVDHATRYERAEEFIAALRALWRKPEPVDFDGEFVKLRGAMAVPGVANGGPKFYLGGASERALSLAGKQSDVYLAWILPKDDIAAHVARAGAKFESAGRRASYGLRTHVITRRTEREAWAAADELLSQAADAVWAQRQTAFAGTAMVGQRSQARAAERHMLAPRLWNGISTVRVNCGTALVGTPEQVASDLLDYWKLGIDEFILSGFPHVEECDRVADEVIPTFREMLDGYAKRNQV